MNQPTVTDWIQALGTIVAILSSTILALVIPLWLQRTERVRYRKAAVAIAVQHLMAGALAILQDNEIIAGEEIDGADYEVAADLMESITNALDAFPFYLADAPAGIMNFMTITRGSRGWIDEMQKYAAHLEAKPDIQTRLYFDDEVRERMLAIIPIIQSLANDLNVTSSEIADYEDVFSPLPPVTRRAYQLDEFRADLINRTRERAIENWPAADKVRARKAKAALNVSASAEPAQMA